MIPSCDYRTTLARDDAGHDVHALQINLNAWRETQEGLDDALVEDGIYGGRTYRRVRTYQRRRSLFVDGICGPRSQRSLAVELLEPQSDLYDLPHGLLRGQVELESAYYVGAVNCSVAGAKDCGWTQRRIKDGATESEYRAAFHGPTCFEKSARSLRQRKDAYYNPAPQAIKDHEFMWKAATLFHNWQAAANRVAEGSFDDWKYVSTFDHTGPADEGVFVEKIDSRYEKRRYGVDDKAQWVMRIGAPSVSTGREWANHYIQKTTLYVESWTP